ncbi:MAG: DUF4296 domain-containing protein [Muribaculaceae bacterium]|nr:DUF4296 domain-containing protein [Muribaculaceae bacterium]
MRTPGLSRYFICAALTCGALCSCNRVPETVIQPEKMAQLMAELSVAEATADANRKDFPTTGDRAALKQSIYTRYGVSGEEVDSSLAWYGRNIREYVSVCDRSIEILEHRMIESGNRSEANALAMVGDSVDVWPFTRFIRISPHDATRTVSFDFVRDDNWESGDIYTWRAKFSNLGTSAAWAIVAEYDGGKYETMQLNFSNDGWQEISFFTDTIGPATRIYGYLTVPDRNTPYVFIDSVSIVRKRFNETLFPQHYRQRRLYNIEGSLHAETDSL